ncbi:MAG: hypothetical protein ETSY1_14665 [Candidatus Entotheonella factor]|uniref:L-lysine 6-monooxygenase n=1 Tax=Entotheonella factor TaxID=1429438 RepID=W4LQ28_ENTF1|nr:SidA/IucD/PvdA family monooxygenase [Candidatus Entotheonella palauensis]ETW99526.1 MAG: hypothetical protein ETSY1_14665 [Candidatus Entotheonella factor]
MIHTHGKRHLHHDNESYDIVGVGIGPANLSVAALLDPLPQINRRFYDRKAHFAWHEGMLLPDAELQVSFLKDLVTLVEPTNRFSFLSFLHAHDRLYAFLNARFEAIFRREFNQYLHWVADSLEDLAFGQSVMSVTLDDQLTVRTDNEQIQTRAIVLGTGLSPKLPPFTTPYVGETVFHGSEYLRRRHQFANKRIAVVGGGQTGAEIFLSLISCQNDSAPASVCWLSRRSNFLPLDDTPFINELFTPSYSDYFYSLDFDVRSRLIAEQKLASDGISVSTLQQIYRRLYQQLYLGNASHLPWSLRPGRELIGLEPLLGGWRLHSTEMIHHAMEYVDVDVVILCTGFEYRMPTCLEPLAHRIEWGPGGYHVLPDFSIAWDGPDDLHIYVQNAAMSARGIADPNLSLLSWRSAKIINSLLGREVYPLRNPQAFIDWSVPDADAMSVQMANVG